MIESTTPAEYIEKWCDDVLTEGDDLIAEAGSILAELKVLNLALKLVLPEVGRDGSHD